MAGKSSSRKSASVTPRAAGRRRRRQSRAGAPAPSRHPGQRVRPGRPRRQARPRTVHRAAFWPSAEADLTTLLDSLNSHMATAVNAITELAVAQQGQHQPIIAQAGRSTGPRHVSAHSSPRC
jgi:hypothetical protein